MTVDRSHARPPIDAAPVPTRHVAITDDHALFVASLGMLLRQRGFVTHRPALADGTVGIFSQLQRLPAGVALLDLFLGRDTAGYPIDGPELVEPLRDLGWAVLVLNDDRHSVRVAAAIATGAVGVVSMLDSLEESLRILDAAADGPAASPTRSHPTSGRTRGSG